jgi:hypothetical protein
VSQSLAKVRSRLDAADELVAKALGLSEVSQMAHLESKAFQYLMAEWNAYAERATRAGVDALVSGSGPITENDVQAVMAAIDGVMDGWADEVLPQFTTDVENIYRLARAAGFKKAIGVTDGPLTYTLAPVPAEQAVQKAMPKGSKLASVLPAFDVVDVQAIEALKSHQVFWIGKHYQNDLSKSIGSTVRNTIMQMGGTRKQAGAAMSATVGLKFKEVETPTGWKGTSKQYFEGLTANAATVARVHGQMKSFKEVGVTHYTISNPGDERTCPVCSQMDGMTWSVKEAQEQLDKELSATSPDAVRAAHPWLSPNQIKTLAPVPGKSTGALGEKGQRVPPYHFKCRCAVDIESESVFKPYTDDEIKELVPPPPPPPPPVTPPPTPPKPPPPPPPLVPPAAAAGSLTKEQALLQKLKSLGKVEKPVAQQAINESGAFPWTEDQLKLMPDKLGGAHTKWVYQAPDGSKWMFKPVAQELEAFRAYGDKVAGDIASALGVPNAEVYVIKARGQTGSIQKLWDDVVGEVGDSRVISTLARPQIEQIQREHAFDWLIGNHDGHGGNLLFRKDGSIAGIDKGQLYKHLDDDFLSYVYNPNKSYGVISYYNRNFEKYAAGKLGKDFVIDMNSKPLLEFLDRVEKLPDAEFLAMIKPYSSRRFGHNAAIENKFLENALARKKGLRKQLQLFYDNVNIERAKNLGTVVPATGESVAVKAPKPKVVKKPKEAPSKEATGPLVSIDKAFIKDINDSGFAGKTLFVAGDDYEGMQFLAYGIDDTSVFLDTKLTAVGDQKLLTWLQANGNVSPAASSVAASTVDEYHDQVLKIFKSVNHHFVGPTADKVLPAHTAEAYKKLFEDLYKKVRLTGNGTPQQEHYLEELAKLYKSGNQIDTTKAGALFNRWEPPAVPVPTNNPAKSAADTKIKVKRLSKWSEPGKKLENGRIKRSIGSDLNFNGEVYEFDLGNGTKALYKRHGDDNRFSKQGKFRLEFKKPPGEITPEDIQTALASLEKLGLGTRLANKDDLELLTLLKVSKAAKKDSLAAFKIDPEKSVVENRDKLKKSWEKALGRELVEGENYKPLPEAEFGKYGWHRHERFDITEGEMLQTDLALYHHLAGDYDDVKRIISGKTNALVATEEKHRIGLPQGGMSPEADQSSGGASYVFTRIKTPEKARGHIRFHPKLLLDPDSVTYHSDAYGNVKPDYMTKHRKRAAKAQDFLTAVPHGSNETILKNSVNLVKWLDEIKVPHETARKQMIQAFKDAGITTVGPHNKPIEKVFVTQWSHLNIYNPDIK